MCLFFLSFFCFLSVARGEELSCGHDGFLSVARPWSWLFAVVIGRLCGLTGFGCVLPEREGIEALHVPIPDSLSSCLSSMRVRLASVLFPGLLVDGAGVYLVDKVTSAE